MKGLCSAVPIIGDRSRTLQKGDLVFVDVAYGFNGYHTDRTQVYMFGASVPNEVAAIHKQCVKLQKRLATELKPGAVPSDIYNSAIENLSDEWKTNFMGFGEKSKRVRFLGHGVGLYVDEFPIIANGFTLPLEENMTVALEPKKGIPNIGLAGAEDTYVVTASGGKCLTGGERDILQV
jgi:Xaa-Pro aminopeptidase